MLDLEERKRWALAPAEKYVLNLTRNHFNIYDANQEAFLDLVRGDIDPTAVKIVRPPSSKKGSTLTKLQLSLNRLTWRRKNNSRNVDKSGRSSTTINAAAVELTEGTFRSNRSNDKHVVSNPVHTGTGNSSLAHNQSSSVKVGAAAAVQTLAERDSDDDCEDVV